LKGIKENSHKPTLKHYLELRRHKTIEERILCPEFNKEVSDDEKDITNTDNFKEMKSWQKER